MSDFKESDYISWLEESISNKHIPYYEYSDFENIQPIGEGAFGSVVRANWKDTDTIFALKRFTNQESTLKEVVNEVRELLLNLFISIIYINCFKILTLHVAVKITTEC